MMAKIVGLGLLAGGAYYLASKQGQGGSARAFGESGIPWKPSDGANAWGGAFDFSGGIPLLPDLIPDTPEPEESGGILDMLDPDWSIFDMSRPRGIRNNNPGNIEHTGTQWQGLDNPPSDGRFARFVSPEYGIRALARTLSTYYNSHGLNTVRGIINRWAPSFENDTSAYASHVASAVGVGVDQPFDVIAKRPQLVRAIIQHENGEQPYSSTVINRGISMA